MPAEKVVFEPGKPIEIALKYSCGKIVQGKFGEQSLYTTVDDRDFYLDAELSSDVDSQLSSLRIQPREYFRIVETRHPRGGGVSFRITRCAPEPETHLEKQLRESVDIARPRNGGNGNGNHSPEPDWANDPAMQQPANGRGATHLAVAPPVHHEQQIAAPSNATARLADNDSTPSIAPGAAKFMAAYKVAIDILLEAQSYGKRLGLLVDIKCEDIRCLAATVIIDNTKGGRA